MPSYLVTGTARGIGLALVDKLSQTAENTVFATVRKSSNLDGLKALNRKNIHIIYSDCADRKQVDESFEQISALTDSLDYLILNAANLTVSFSNLKQIYDSEEATKEFEKINDDMMKTNVYDQLYYANKFLPLIEKGTTKKIIATTSGIADYNLGVDTNIDINIPYSISKAAFNIAFSRLAVTLKPKEIMVLLVSPGLVDTTGFPPEKVLEFYKPFVLAAKRVKPELEGPMTTKQCADAFVKTMEYFDMESTGRIVSQYGSSTRFF